MKYNMPTAEELLAHYTRLAGTPGWKQYCWHRAKELERCETGMWDGIAEALKKAMASVDAARPHARDARG